MYCVAIATRRENYRQHAPENGRISAVNTKYMAMLVVAPELRYDKTDASVHYYLLKGGQL